MAYSMILSMQARGILKPAHIMSQRWLCFSKALQAVREPNDPEQTAQACMLKV